MAIFFTILIKLIPLYSVIILGYIFGKFFNILKEIITKLLLYFIVPVVIFNGIVTTKISISTLSIPVLFFLICSFISVIIFYLAGFIWKDSTRNILAFIAGSSNTGYLGLPIIVALFGNSAIGIVSLVVVGTSLYTNSFGLFITARGKYTAKESLVKILKLPIIYVFFLGLIVQIIGIKFGKPYFEIINIFNFLFSFLGMFLIGIGLSDIKKFNFDWKFIGMSFFSEFVLWPILTFIILLVDENSLRLYNTTLGKIIMVMSVLPVATNIIVYAIFLKTQPEKVSLVVFLSTLFSLFYIPLFTTLVLK